MFEISSLEINRNNVLNWLMFLKEIYPLSDEDKRKIERFVKTRYTVRRDKILDELFDISE